VETESPRTLLCRVKDRWKISCVSDKKSQKHKKEQKKNKKEPKFWYLAEPDKGESTAWLTPHQQDPS